LPSLAFFFILTLMTFRLNPPSATLHWLIFPKHNKFDYLRSCVFKFPSKVDLMAIIWKIQDPFILLQSKSHIDVLEGKTPIIGILKIQ
jgi:hypothetical protein